MPIKQKKNKEEVGLTVKRRKDDVADGDSDHENGEEME